MKSRTTRSGLGNYKPEPSTLEITETEIIGTHNQQESHSPYPRHISRLKSQSHRGYRNTVNRIASLPKICNLPTSQSSQKVNAAVNILQYQLSDRLARQNHLNNIRHSLKRRLQAAEASGDRHLIDLLNDEFKQLKTSV